MQAGFEPDTFWHQTPTHFQYAMRGVRKRHSQEAEFSMSMAWHTANFNAATKTEDGIPKLEDVLARLKQGPKRKQTMKEMLVNMQRLAARQNAIHQRQMKEAGHGDSAR